MRSAQSSIWWKNCQKRLSVVYMLRILQKHFHSLFFASLATLLHQLCLFFHVRFNSHVCVWYASFFSPKLHHCLLAHPSCLRFLVPLGWLDDGFLSLICCVHWPASSQLWHHTRVCLTILQRILGFPSLVNPGFCTLKTRGRWTLPCDARVSACVHGASFWRHQCQIDCTVFVTLSRTGGVWGLLLTQLWRGRL